MSGAQGDKEFKQEWEGSEKLWDEAKLLLGYKPEMCEEHCYCMNKIGPHVYYATKCCKKPMHRKCFFNLVDSAMGGTRTSMKCPFCSAEEYVDSVMAKDYLHTNKFPISTYLMEKPTFHYGKLVSDLMITRKAVDEIGTRRILRIIVKKEGPQRWKKSHLFIVQHAIKRFGWDANQGDARALSEEILGVLDNLERMSGGERLRWLERALNYNPTPV